MRAPLALVAVLAVAVLAAVSASLIAPAAAQPGPPGPPAVGVITAARRPVIETNSFVGRIQAIDKVDIVARVTAFIAERAFQEGTEVAEGDLLYRLERGPFEADVQAKQAAVAQNQALLRNATIKVGRAQTLLSSPAGSVSSVDDSEASRASQAAQMLAAQAQLKQSQINLAYTEIRAPVAGRVAKTTVTTGNVVGPSTGALTTVVSQDPMYVLFPVSLRTALDLRNRYADKGGFSAVVIRLLLPDGTKYPLTGKLDYIDPSVAPNTDTVNLRARIANPLRAGTKPNEPGNRELIDGSFVTVSVEGVAPVQALAIPRSAVLSDQQGSFVYTVDAEKKIAIKRIQLGQSTPETAAVLQGLAEGDSVVVEGLQRVRPGIVVNPGPAGVAPGVPGPASSGAAAPAPRG
jgi:membrane fusion protein (multidrug efflux system)